MALDTILLVISLLRTLVFCFILDASTSVSLLTVGSHAGGCGRVFIFTNCRTGSCMNVHVCHRGLFLNDAIADFCSSPCCTEQTILYISSVV